MLVVLRGPAQNADLGMWLFSRQEMYRLTSVGGSQSDYISCRQTGDTSLQILSYVKFRNLVQLLPTRHSSLGSNVMAGTESRPEVRLT